MSAPATRVLHHGVWLQVDADDAEDRTYLRDLLGDLAIAPRGGGPDPQPVHVGIRRLDVHAWSVTSPAEVLRPTTRADLGRAVLRALHHAARDGRTSVLLHAGAVAGGRGAVLLAGRSGVGKSTLVAACLRGGALGLTDELVAVADTGLVTGSPAPLNLKAGANAVLGHLGTDGALFREDGPLRMSAAGRTSRDPAPVAAVIGLSRAPDPLPRTISGRDAALLLGQLVIPTGAGTDRGLGAIGALVERASTTAVMGRQDLAAATRFVLDLAGVR